MDVKRARDALKNDPFVKHYKAWQDAINQLLDNDFTFLMTQTGLTWGNLSSHLTRLEKANYVAVEKRFVGKRPYTLLHLTQEGRVAFQSYRQKMKEVFEDLPD